MPHLFTSEGFILAKRNFGEADRILVIYSKDKGKLSLIAKGVRKVGSRKRGHLEIFNKIKFQASNGKGIGIITEAETVDDYKKIRCSIKKVTLAYYFMEVMGKITHEGESNHELYQLLSATMGNLKNESKLKNLRVAFVSDLLKILGFWPKGKELTFPDKKLEEVLERQISSMRVGKRILSC